MNEKGYISFRLFLLLLFKYEWKLLLGNKRVCLKSKFLIMIDVAIKRIGNRPIFYAFPFFVEITNFIPMYIDIYAMLLEV